MQFTPVPDDKPVTIRPSLIYDNRDFKKFLSYTLAIALVVSVIFYLTLPLAFALGTIAIVFAIFVVPCTLQLLHHFLEKVQIAEDKLSVTDYVRDYLNFLIDIRPRQEILFSDVSYIYFADKETQLLSNLRAKLEKYGIPDKETDYTKQNLASLYGVPSEIFEKFENSFQKALTDYSATGVLMALDEIYRQHNIPKSLRKEIKAALKDDKNFNPDFLMGKLRPYPLSAEETENLKASLANTDAQVLLPFLHTKVNIAKFRRFENSSRSSRNISVNAALVLSNEDGMKKLYFMHFGALSVAARRQILEQINRKNPAVKYLMPKQSLNALLRT